jgi:hypothetical protein
MMRITGRTLANETRLRSDEEQMGFAPFANTLGADSNIGRRDLGRMAGLNPESRR